MTFSSATPNSRPLTLMRTWCVSARASLTGAHNFSKWNGRGSTAARCMNMPCAPNRAVRLNDFEATTTSTHVDSVGAIWWKTNTNETARSFGRNSNVTRMIRARSSTSPKVVWTPAIPRKLSISTPVVHKWAAGQRKCSIHICNADVLFSKSARRGIKCSRHFLMLGTHARLALNRS